MRTKQKQWSDRVFEKPFLSWFWNVNMLMCRLLWSRATRTVIFMLAWLFVSFEKLPRKKSVTARHRLSPSAMNVDWEEASSSLAAGAMGTITLVRGISRFYNDPTRASWSKMLRVWLHHKTTEGCARQFYQSFFSCFHAICVEHLGNAVKELDFKLTLENVYSRYRESILLHRK